MLHQGQPSAEVAEKIRRDILNNPKKFKFASLTDTNASIIGKTFSGEPLLMECKTDTFCHR